MEYDTTWVKGKVTKKYIDDGKCCVDIEIQNLMQTGANSVTGGATVILPSREYGQSYIRGLITAYRWESKTSLVNL